MKTKHSLFGKLLSHSFLLVAAVLLVGSSHGSSVQAQWSTSETNVYYNGGNVGIGTSSPGWSLDVSNNQNSLTAVNVNNTTTGTAARAGYLFSVDGHTSGITATNSAYTPSGVYVANGTNLLGEGSGGLTLSARDAAGTIKFFAGGSTERMRINASGNVGIGTTSPGAKLEVSRGGSSGEGIRISSGASGNCIYYGIGRTGLESLFGIASGSDQFFTGTAAGDFIINAQSSSQKIFFGAGTSATMVMTSANVGIGTTPSALLHISKAGSAELRITDSSSGNPYISFYDGATPKGYLQYSSGNVDVYGPAGVGVRLVTNSVERMRIDSSGNVGIGVAPSTYKLDISGNTRVTGDFNTTGTITGGNIQAKYQDVAEWVPSAEPVSAGTVVVLDPTKSNQVTSSTVSYDTRVAGVVSEQPGITLGDRGAGKVLVATTGRVLVKVDASQGPIHIGDLLVTSDAPGVAMKSVPVSLGGVQLHRPGTLIGKALEPMEKGSGKILVLLSLQ